MHIENNNPDAAPVDPTVLQEKLPIERHAYDKHFVPVFFLLGYLFVDWIMFGGLGASATVYSMVFTASTICWFYVCGKRIGREAYPYLAVMLLIAVYFLVYDNLLLKPLALMLQMMLACYCVTVIGNARIEPHIGGYLALDMLDSAVVTPFSNFIAAPRVLAAEARGSANSKKASLLTIGIIAGLIPAFFVATMLLNADAAFESLVNRLYGNFFENSLETTVKLMLSIPVWLYLYGLVFGTKRLGDKPRLGSDAANTMLKKLRLFPTSLVIGVVTPLLLLYTVFFISQSAYFLSAFKSLLPVGFSYAEYARRGFFELCSVSGVNLCFILALLLLTGKSAERGWVVKAYCTIIIMFSIALVVISQSKMLMYIGIYGLTQKRLYTSAFMLLLLAVFVYLTVRTYNSGFNWVKWAAVTAVAGFLVFCLIEPDYLIARYNVENYKSGRLDDLDVTMIFSLSSAAVPCILDAYEYPELPAEKRTHLRDYLLTYKHAVENNYDSDWRQFNITRMRANRFILDADLR